MYDWPEVRGSTDALWHVLRESLSDHGFARLPDELARGSDPHADWVRPDLILSQTCGLPFVRELQGRVKLLGTPSYDIDCGSGAYYSVLIAREDVPDDPDESQEYAFAYNDVRSQSGYAAFLRKLIADASPLPERYVATGSHRASIAAVAEGRADIAAIDAVTWGLACRHDADAERVKVIGKTSAMPGLPFITSFNLSDQAETMRLSISEAMEALPAADREALLLTGFVARQETDYQPIAENWQAIVERGWQDLPVSAQR